MAPRPIYLDHNATCPLEPAARRAMLRLWDQDSCFGNPASAHRFGRRARRELEDFREGMGRLLGVKIGSPGAGRLIFTSSGTEANNLALFGLAGQQPARVVVSPIEHPSVSAAAAELARRGWAVQHARVDRDGRIDLEHLRSLLQQPTRLVSLMLGNHETGVLQPVSEAASLCRAAGAALHTDLVQVAGKRGIDFDQIGAAAAAVSAHKFGGPVGIGCLLLRHDTVLEPILFGGQQQYALRPGTEPVASAAGMSAALEVWRRDGDARSERLADLRDRLETNLRSGYAGLVVHGDQVERLPHVSCVAFPGLDRQALLMALDLAGVACSAGSACASGSSEPSPVLLAMGVPDELVQASIRLSLGPSTTEQDVDEAAARILQTANDLRRGSVR